MIHRPSLADFARDLLHFAATLTAVAVVTDLATENRRLWIARRELEAENEALAAVADDLAHQLAQRHLDAGEPVYAELSREFGSSVLLDAWTDLADDRIAGFIAGGES